MISKESDLLVLGGMGDPDPSKVASDDFHPEAIRQSWRFPNSTRGHPLLHPHRARRGMVERGGVAAGAQLLAPPVHLIFLNIRKKYGSL